MSRWADPDLHRLWLPYDEDGRWIDTIPLTDEARNALGDPTHCEDARND